MALWADGDAISPDNMNNQQLSALTVDGATNSRNITIRAGSTAILTWDDSGNTWDFQLTDAVNVRSLSFISGSAAIPSVVSGRGFMYVNDVGALFWVDGSDNSIQLDSAIPSGSTIGIAEAGAEGGLAGDAVGTAGDITWGSSSGVSFLYVCTSTDSWSRAALNPF